MHQMNLTRRQGMRGLMGLVLGGASLGLQAQTRIRVLAASDLKFALAHIAERYEMQKLLRVEITFGSSGNLARQIAQGLPADLFLSADEALVAQLHARGLTRDAGVVYARGRLAMLVQGTHPLAHQLNDPLRGLAAWLPQAPGDFKLAIANPDHAPYGRAAREALQRAGLWTGVQPHLVVGDSVAQAAQFVTTGAAAAAIASQSLALAPEVNRGLRTMLLGEGLHAPIVQRMVLLKQSSAAAQAFYTHLQSAAVAPAWRSHGFS
jgi:molybdate transport system substrate-binding protein